MKRVTMVAFALLATICGSGAVADGDRQDGGRGGESTVAAAQGGEWHEAATPGTVEGQRRGSADGAAAHRDEQRGRGGDGARGQPPDRNRIIYVPIAVPQDYYDYPPAGAEQPPQYIEEDGSYYWYYCPNLGYYPNVQECPGGWLRVVPNGP